MTSLGLSPSPALHLLRYSDVEAYRQGVLGLQRTVIPLERGVQTAEQAVLRLPDCDLHLVDAFPRIVDGIVSGDGLFIGIALDEKPPIIFNGMEVTGPGITIGRDGDGFKLQSFKQGKDAAIVFHPRFGRSGWPQSRRSVVYSANVQIERWRQLRGLILHAFQTASHHPESFVLPEAQRGLQDALIDALDGIFFDAATAANSPSDSFLAYWRLVDQIDEFIAADLATPIYSSDVARHIDVSPRTLHTAMMKVRGMSLHRYLRLRRLLAVRHRLLASGRGTLIKSVALANGFWHMGEFSAMYLAQFGETPSQTLRTAA